MLTQKITLSASSAWSLTFTLTIQRYCSSRYSYIPKSEGLLNAPFACGSAK